MIGYHLDITVPKTGNTELDIASLGSAYRALTNRKGRDTFQLLVPVDLGEVGLEFPDRKTYYCVSLVRELETILGAGCIEVSMFNVRP